MKVFKENVCPRCHHAPMKSWDELTADEKILAERLPLSATFARREREAHLFCPRCWHEEADETAYDC